MASDRRQQQQALLDELFGDANKSDDNDGGGVDSLLARPAKRARLTSDSETPGTSDELHGDTRPRLDGHVEKPAAAAVVAALLDALRGSAASAPGAQMSGCTKCAATAPEIRVLLQPVPGLVMAPALLTTDEQASRPLRGKGWRVGGRYGTQ